MNGFDNRRLNTWLAILSLDVVSPYLDSMLVPVPASYLTGPLRRRILENRSRALPTGDSDVSELIRVVISDLQENFDDAGRKFEQWYLHAATLGWNDRPDWALWYNVFREWGFGELPSELAHDARFRQVVERYVEVMQFRQLRASTEQARKGSLSDWDAQMFALHHYYDLDDDDDASYDPFLPIRNTIWFVRLRQFHAELMKVHDAPVIELLTAAARKTALRVGHLEASQLRSFADL